MAARANGSRQTGASIVFVLVAVAISSLLIAGVLTLAVSHLTLAADDRDYSNALNLAEAGVDYELWKIGARLWRGLPLVSDGQPCWDTPETPHRKELPPGSGHWFEVYITPASDASATWDQASPFYVISKGYIERGTDYTISRTVRYMPKGGPDDWGDYAIFGVSSSTKSITMSGSSTLTGRVGTNGLLTASGNTAVYGGLDYCGWGTKSPITAPVDIYDLSSPPQPLTATFRRDPVIWPTVDQIANQVAGQLTGVPQFSGIDYFRLHNDNANLPSPYSTSLKWTVSGGKALSLPPGNYYVNQLTLSGGSYAQLDFSHGVGDVNIWVNSNGLSSALSGGSQGAISGQNVYFHVYFAGSGTLTYSGGSVLNAMLYAYDGKGGSTVTLSGGSKVNGSVIANTINLSGPSTITYVKSSTSGKGSPGNFFGDTRRWEELRANS